jgi:PAS domain S-box-containing protein
MNTPENKQGKESIFVESLKRPNLWLVILIVFLTIVFYLLDIQASWDSSVLIFLLNIVLVVIPAFFIAAISFWGFLQSGSWQIMWLGVGTLTYGLAVLLSFWVKTMASANAQATTFTIVYLLASLFFFIGSLLAINKASLKAFSSSRGRLTNLLLIYFIVAALISLITFVSVRELLPPFFIQGEGSTDLRITLQLIALVLFLISGLLIIANYLKSKTAFLLWYGLGLILTVVNTAGNLVLTSFGTPLNWILRSAQLLAGIYLLMASVTILREAKAKHMPASEIMVDPFTQLETRLKESEKRFLNAFQASPVAQTIERLPEGRWVEVNDSFLRMLGFTRGEIIGHTSAELNIIDQDERARVLRDVIDKGSQRGKEMTVRTKAGESLTVLSFDEKIVFNGQNHSISTLLDITERKKAEEALQRKQDELQALFDYSNASLALFDAKPPYTVLAHNKYYQRLWPEPFKTCGMVGKNLLDYVPGVEAQGVMAVYDEVVKTKKPKSLINFPYEGMPQGKTWWNWHLSPVIQNGEVISLAHIGINVTEEVTARQKVEEQNRLLEEKNEALGESEAKANALIKYAPTGIYEIDFRTGRFLSVNDAMSTLTGYTKEELFALGPAGLLDDESKRVFTDRARRQLAGGKVDETVEYRVKRKDGSLIFVNLNVSFSKVNPSTIFVVGHDITERKKAEDQLRESEERFRALSETSPIGVGVSSADGVLLYANPSYELILGYNHTELVGKNASALYWNPEDRQSWVSSMKDGRVARNIETRLKRKDGTPIWVSINASPVFYGGNQAVMGTIQDITDRKEAEQALKRSNTELEASNKELEAFAYSVSHDLRQPLRTLDGFSEMVIMDYGDKLDETGKDYLNRIRKASQNMSQLTEDILKLSRITRAEMHRHEVNLTEIATAIAYELKATQPNRKAEFIIAPDLVVNGDKALIEILLRNILDNAWKYTSQIPDAIIEMGAKSEEGRTIYFVKDNGVGFDMQYKDKLFQPFQRLHTGKEYPGTGIGLATAQRVVRRHSGDIWTESEVGKGTTFYFTVG